MDQPILAAVAIVNAYAELFEPGVYGEEQLPQFVESFSEIQPSLREIVLQHPAYLQGPVDQWSAAMELRLRDFLESTPEKATMRFGVSCRATQCILQITSVDGPPDESRRISALLGRLEREAWYRENFHRTGGKGVAFGIARVFYTVRTLQRL
jgi:hypothetical protein